MDRLNLAIQDSVVLLMPLKMGMKILPNDTRTSGNNTMATVASNKDTSIRVLLVGHAPHAVHSLTHLLQNLHAEGMDCQVCLLPQRDAAEVELLGQKLSMPVENYPDITPPPPAFFKVFGARLYNLIRNISDRYHLRKAAIKFLNAKQPSILLLTIDSGVATGFLVREANARNIPTVLIQWAFSLPQEYYNRLRNNDDESETSQKTSPSRPSLQTLRNSATNRILSTMGLTFESIPGFGGGESKKIAVMGEAFVEQFARQGVPKEKMVVTGHPDHDQLYNRLIKEDATALKNHILQDLQIPNGKLAVLCTQAVVHFGISTLQEYQKQIHSIVDAILENEDINLVIKLHPRENIHDYDFVHAYSPRVSAVQDYELISLIHACDLFLSQYSSTILLAMGFGKPIITFNFDGKDEKNFFASLGGSLHAKNIDDFRVFTKTILHPNTAHERLQEKQQEIISRYMKLDGKALERMTELIRQEMRIPESLQ